MSALGEVIAQIRAALGRAHDARRHLVHAGGLIEEAARLLTQLLSGSTDQETERSLGLLDRARQDLIGAYALVEQTEGRAESYLRMLVADPGAERREPTPPTADATPLRSPTRERIEQLRAELPPPVARNSGQKTHGRWLAPDGSSQPMISGWDSFSQLVNDTLRAEGCERLPARAAADVGLKLAALMRDRGKTDPAMRHVTLVINNRPCKGDLSCDELVPVILPEGYSLTVHAPNYRKRFTGGAKPWWR